MCKAESPEHPDFKQKLLKILNAKPGATVKVKGDELTREQASVRYSAGVSGFDTTDWILIDDQRLDGLLPKPKREIKLPEIY